MENSTLRGGFVNDGEMAELHAAGFTKNLKSLAYMK